MTIDVEPLIDRAASQPRAAAGSSKARAACWCPLNERDLMVDLYRCAWRLPVLVVSRSGLGTINHTLLTLEALGRRAVPIAGVVMVGPPDDPGKTGSRSNITAASGWSARCRCWIRYPYAGTRSRRWAETDSMRTDAWRSI